ncbi:hypothetical protein BDR04DRAFT_1090361 [Suillus decipiens]|nr:hypothetical protein BDR04DRAFT_1090361 [Suillus decipiens]
MMTYLRALEWKTGLHTGLRTIWKLSRQLEWHVETVINFSAFALALWLMVQCLVRSTLVQLYLESWTSFHTARAM